MKSTTKKIITMLTVIFIGILINSTVLAANLNVKINCNGKTIKMTSETPDMTWTVSNLLPGEKDESTLTIENIGTKKVDVDLKAKIESGEDLAQIVDLKIIKLQSDSGAEQELFSGKYNELKSINVNIENNKKETYKFVTSLPTETGNEYQGRECVIKLGLVASGEEDKPETPKDEPKEEPKDEPEDEPKEEPKKENKITTDKIESPQTGEGILLYVVAGVLIIAFVIFLITFIVNRKGKNENK